MSEAFGHFRVGFVTGATPDKWARTWRERFARDPLELVPLTEDEQEERIREGTLDMSLVRLPVDRDGLHCIPLYEELPVAVIGTEHLLTLADEVHDRRPRRRAAGAARRGRAGPPTADQLAWPPMAVKDAVEVVASGTGVVHAADVDRPAPQPQGRHPPRR